MHAGNVVIHSPTEIITAVYFTLGKYAMGRALGCVCVCSREMRHSCDIIRIRVSRIRSTPRRKCT